MTFGTVDISLTTISSRVEALPRTLRSLLDQTYGDLRVRLYVSREPYLLDDGIEELPESMRELAREAADRLVVTYTRNVGPYRKLLPYLFEHWGQSRLVVTADDDTIYPRDWLEGLLQAHDAYGCVAAYRAHPIRVRDGELLPYRLWMKGQFDDNPTRLVVPTGKDGVLYDTAYFPINVLNVTDALRVSPTADDLWFRWHLSSNGIPAYVINLDYASSSFEESDYDSSLYLNFNKGGQNDAAIGALDVYFRERFGFAMADLAS